MKSAKSFLMISVFLLTAFFIFNAFAESKAVLSNKKIHNITDQEIENVLQQTKKEDMKKYEQLMEMKKENPDYFETTLINGVIANRMLKLQLKPGTAMSLDDYKKIYNITDKEIEMFLNKMRRETPELYQELMALKTENPAFYNSSLFGGILKERTPESKDDSAINIKEIEKIDTSIASEQSKYLRAQSKDEKEKSLLKLKQLLSKQFDASLANFDAQIKSLKAQLEMLEKTKQDALGNKEASIEGKLSQIKKLSK